LSALPVTTCIYYPREAQVVEKKSSGNQSFKKQRN